MFVSERSELRCDELCDTVTLPSMSHRTSNTNMVAQDRFRVEENSELKEFLHIQSKLNRMPESEFRERLIHQYGTLEAAMKEIQAVFAENKAAIDNAFPPGQQAGQIGISPQ
jgi:hypothetical protein